MERQRERTSFCEQKEAKKLYLFSAGGSSQIPCKIHKSLLRSFSSEKRPLTSLGLPCNA
jgi:hypothetical protein